MEPIDYKTFRKFADIIYEKCGICLKDTKVALLSARTKKRMRALQIYDYKDYLDYVSQEENEAEIINLIDSISTNVTSFFRESSHFDVLNEAVRNWINGGQRRFRFWSAACSTGEEPFSIAITLKEASEGPAPSNINTLASA